MSGNVFQYINADGLGDFGYPGNWFDKTNPYVPGPPGPTDVALVVATGTISGTANVSTLVKGDTIDLSKIIASSLTYSGQTLTVHESGGASLALKFAGTYASSSFGMTSDGHSGTLITHS